MATASPTVSVIIPAYTMDRWGQLRLAVNSAQAQTYSPLEIVVCIDNNPELLATALCEWGSADSTGDVPVSVVSSEYSHEEKHLSVHAQAHGARRRFGAGQARNTAAAHTTGDILATLDDDAAAEPTWIEELLRPYADDRVLAVGGRPLPDYETSRPSWFPRQFDWVFGCAYEGLPTVTGPCLRLIGANMSVRSETFRKVGGFQSIDFDDMDLCHRVAAYGGSGSVVYTPEAVVHHYVPAQRVSWHYFWRRCFYVNRHKVEAHQGMGEASTFGPDVRFVLQTLSMGLLREARNLLRGDLDAARRVGAVLVGIACAAGGNAVGRMDLFRQR